MLAPMARFALTGATGFLGAEVAKQLRTAGHEVIALVRHPERARLLAAMGVQMRPGDLCDRAALRAVMAGADGVFHLAAWYRLGGRRHVAEADATRTNVEGTRAVLETMREVGVPKGVYTSTVAVFSDTQGRVPDESYRYDGPFRTVYEATKWAAHYQVALPLMAEGLPLVIVQPGTVYGPGDTSVIRHLWTELLRGRMPLIPGHAVFAWGYIDDIARGHLQAMAHGVPGQTYILTGPAHPVGEALRLAAQCAGRRPPVGEVPVHVMRAVAWMAGLVERVVDLPPQYASESLRAAAGATYLGDGRRAARDLGFTARPLLDGLRVTIEHEQRQLGLRTP